MRDATKVMETSGTEVPEVDVVVLHRPGQPPPKAVIEAIERQTGVKVHLHMHVGAPQAGDLNRWYTIARARNAMRLKGVQPWVMFVDDDVVLAPNCISALYKALLLQPTWGAVAADYSGDCSRPGRQGHVALGATLFRRDVARRLQFRATPRWCECWCAAFDLRYNGVGIEYVAQARAKHLKQQASSAGSASKPTSVILAAFDRRDIRRFEHFFLRSLRASGNRELVVAVGYGLYPSETKRLQCLPGIKVIARPNDGRMVPVRRLDDFGWIASQLSPSTTLAYWDVADVIFQGSLQALWLLATNNPTQILAVAEPNGYPHNAVIPAWSLSIRDPQHRLRAFSLLKRNPFLNSGFAAGTAAAMAVYFRRAAEMLRGCELSGTTDWGDQMALNIFCHSQPDRWLRVDERWNYCVHDRAQGEVRIDNSGRIISRRGQPITVAHGNARSLRQFALVTA